MTTTAAPMFTRDRLALLILAACTLGRLIVAANLPLVEDEAYYWTWSTRLAAGYYDHPPAIAWIIATGTAILGKTALGVRAAGILLTTLATVPLLGLVRSRALLAAILGSMPLFALGGVLATPDVPLIAGWMLLVGGFGRFASDGRLGWILLAGFGGALALLGKYTALGFWPLAAVWVGIGVLRPLNRVRWTLAFSSALGLTALLTAPHLRWSVEHDWVSLRFQLHHGLGATAAPGIGGALEFLGAQLGLGSPVLLGAGLVAAWKHRAALWEPQPITRLALLTSLPVLGFFTFAATRSRPEVNWAAPAFVGFALLIAGTADSPASPRITRAGWIGVGIAAALTSLVVTHAFSPFLRLPNDPIARLGQGRKMAESVAAWGVNTVWTTRYQEAALLRWYADIPATTVPEVDRVDQFDLWRQAGLDAEDPSLFVRPYRSGEATVVDGLCRRGGANVVTEQDDAGVRLRWQVYEVSGCTR